jgi:hypothetical protein
LLAPFNFYPVKPCILFCFTGTRSEECNAFNWGLPSEIHDSEERSGFNRGGSTVLIPLPIKKNKMELIKIACPACPMELSFGCYSIGVKS